MGPMSGIRIVDLTTVLMGPFATQILGEMGADVIKVEAPAGDITRNLGPSRTPGMGALYLNTNRFKRSICLDLKQGTARETLLSIIDTADVLVTNIRPSAMSRLGLKQDELRKRNPKLIYAALLGYGANGPNSGKPAYDDLIQAGSGLASLMGMANNSDPRYVPTALADRVVGLAAVGAINAALISRERTGKGDVVEVSMLETMTNLIMGDHMAGRTFEPQMEERSYQRLTSPHRKPYKTRDGFISAIIYTDAHWCRFLEAINMQDLAKKDSRFSSFSSRNASIDYVYNWLSQTFKNKTTDDWLSILQAADLPVAKVQSLDSLCMDEHLEDIAFFKHYNHPSEGKIRTIDSGTQWPEHSPPQDKHAPLKGEHGIEILKEAAIPQELINDLIASQALILPEAHINSDG